MALDPVCLQEVDESNALATADFRGKTYYFTSEECKEQFVNMPEKYLFKEPFGRIRDDTGTMADDKLENRDKEDM